MRKLLGTIALIGSMLWVAGCGQGAPPDASAPLSPEAAAKDAATPEEAVKGGAVEVINDPSQAKAGGSYRIEPSNPNDPKYKADPRLAGGG